MKRLSFFLTSALLMGISLSSIAQDTIRMGQRQKMQKQDRIHQNSYFVFENGKLYWIAEGNRNQVKQSMEFKSGLVINPDGSYQYGSTPQAKLNEGEYLDMHAHRYSNEETIRKHVQEGHFKNRNANQGRGNKPRGRKN